MTDVNWEPSGSGTNLDSQTTLKVNQIQLVASEEEGRTSFLFVDVESIWLYSFVSSSSIAVYLQHCP